MQFVNFGLPCSGLESVRQAMAYLGVLTRPRKPFTYRDWLTRAVQKRQVDLLQGPEFPGAYYETVFATLQELEYPHKIFYTYRPLEKWLRSAQHHFQNPPTTDEEAHLRLKYFDSIYFDPQKFQHAYEDRLKVARNTPHVTLLLMDPILHDRTKWTILRQIVGDTQVFPHANKTPTPPQPPAYQPHELVA
jgi:hypothetical protein